jgi:HTH-type transcriptional regulator, glycine betaine synthesis regulator
MVVNMAKDDEADLPQTQLRVADTIGSLMEFWGFKRPMGRLWTVLFLSEAPKTAAELGEQLSMSTGAVSMTVAELLKWGAVKKTWKPGDRRDFFEAETSIWKMVTRVVRERELALVRDAAEVFEEAEGAMLRRSKAAAAAEGARLRFAAARIGQLLSLARAGEALLRSMVAGEAADPAPIREVAAPKR